MEKAESLSYRGYKIDIHYDENYSETPNDWDGEDHILVYDHRDFTIEVKGLDAQEIFEHFQTHKTFPFRGKRYWILPVYAYIHSGVALSLGRSGYPFTDRWDTSFKGFMLVMRNPQKCNSKEAAIKSASGTIEVWNQILSGQVYGYNVIDSEGDLIDSCWGYVGDMDYPIQEAKSIVDYRYKEKLSEHLEKVKTWILNRVPLIYRKELVWM